MIPLKNFPAEAFRSVSCVLTDIDDTLTRDGKLEKEAFSALWALSDAGIRVVPVTGRPAGWCDCIVRQWPVSAVVGENGAFAYFLDNRARRKILFNPEARPDSLKKLEKLKKAVLREVPQARVSGDQPFRQFDLAIDFAEEEPNLGLDTAEKIAKACISKGAEAKISSIHVNTWYGNYNKVSMSLIVLKELFNMEDPDKEVLFCGDSPNDEPMFARFPLSCAVGNIMPFISRLKHLPACITELSGGKGFAELSALVLASKMILP